MMKKIRTISNMKKIIILVMLFLLSACSISKDEVKTVINKARDLSVERGLLNFEEPKNEELKVGEVVTKQTSNEWQVYENKDANFTFKYPQEINLGYAIDSEGLNLSVTVVDIETIDELEVLSEDSQDIIQEKENDEYGLDSVWSLENSRKIREIGDINAHEYVTLSRFEVCDVTFERTLVFFTEKYRVSISLIGPREKIINESLDFFKEDFENCPNQKVWLFEKQSQFYSEIREKKMSGTTQAWYDLFDNIVNTIEIGSAVVSDYTNRAKIEQINLNEEENQPELAWPKISGIKKEEAYNKIINILNYKNVSGETVQDTLKEYKRCNCGIIGTSYAINYNNNGILSISITMDIMQAYPSQLTKNYLIDLNSGNLLSIEDVVKEEDIKKLVSLCNNKLQKTIEDSKKAIIENKIDIPLKYYTGEFKENNLKYFVVNENGINFIYNFEFPQTIKSAEPSPYVFVTFEEISQYFLENGALNILYKK